jgi:hypothetical protein
MGLRRFERRHSGMKHKMSRGLSTKKKSAIEKETTLIKLTRTKRQNERRSREDGFEAFLRT